VADLLARRLAELQGLGNSPTIPDVPSPTEVKPPPSQEILKPASWFRWPESFNRRWAIVVLVLLRLFASLGLTEATGVTDFHGTVIHLFSPEGTLVVEVEVPAVSVKIAGSETVIEGAGAKEIRLQPGRYAVEATKNGQLVQQKLVVGNSARNGLGSGGGVSNGSARLLSQERSNCRWSRGLPARCQNGGFWGGLGVIRNSLRLSGLQ
jgi:hypothetical protein